jgi:diacylglycerol kinase family enzyme
VRAFLIVNPHATSTTAPRRDVIVRALASFVKLEVVQTRYRGHAAELAREAAADGHEMLFTLGGDGTINEAVNGLCHPRGAWGAPDGSSGLGGSGGPGGAGSATARQGPGARVRGDGQPDAAGLPALVPIPGGSANVFVRTLGIPTDPIDATGAIIEAIRAGRQRRIGLGLAGGRYFTFSAGLGLDAEVIRAVEGHRADGRPASPALYFWTALRHFYGVTDRRTPALTLERDGQAPIGPLFIAIISNTSPWTYLGNRPVNPNPRAGYDTGLDVFALRRLRTLGTLSALRQMTNNRGSPPSGRHIVSLHDQEEFTLRAKRPIACQVDGEYVGESEYMTFRSVPDALRVVA